MPMFGLTMLLLSRPSAAPAKPVNAPRPPGTGFVVAAKPAPKPVVIASRPVPKPAPVPVRRPAADSDSDDEDKPKGGFFGLFGGAPKK